MTHVRLLGAQEVRALAAELGITPTKRLGQNFVTDANTVRRIVRLARVTAGQHVLEVGPGLGSLTLALLEAGAEVAAVEIDARLAGALAGTARRHAPDDAHRLTVHHLDALAATPQAVPGAPARLVANLPYNLAVPILMRLLARFDSLASGVVMVQAEVGERLAARPGTKVYGAPSVKAAWYGRWRPAGTVSRHVFWPAPNVDSLLVSFERHDAPPGPPALRERVFALVDAAFAQRRKMLRGALAPLFGDAVRAARALTAAGIDPAARGERLTVGDFTRLAQARDAAAAGPGAEPPAADPAPGTRQEGRDAASS